MLLEEYGALFVVLRFLALHSDYNVTNSNVMARQQFGTISLHLYPAESSHKRLPTAFIIADSGPCRGHALLTIVRKERPGPLPCFIHTAA